ncbi:hypothetical protein J6590_035850 [Homalodisca vitripennis]|nr:hypothetical protein J6590_035850 [Homalodisca vitripennis]
MTVGFSFYRFEEKPDFPKEQYNLPQEECVTDRSAYYGWVNTKGRSRLKTTNKSSQLSISNSSISSSRKPQTAPDRIWPRHKLQNEIVKQRKPRVRPQANRTTRPYVIC